MTATEAPAAGPPLAAERRRRLLADITPLRESQPYRRLWAGQTLSAFGTQMTAVAVPVQVFQMTQSSAAVGLLGLVTVVPLISVGLLGGSLVDAVDRRRLVLITSTLLALCSVALLAQALLDLRSLLVLYAVSALQAGVAGLDQPARGTFVPRLLPPHRIPAATALGQMSMQASLTVGPLAAGLVIAAGGVADAYALDVLSFAAALWAVLRLPAMRPDGGGTRPGLRAVAEGFRWLRGQPVVTMTFVADIVAMLFGMPRALFPALAALHFAGDPSAVGLLYAAPGIGGLLGAAFSGPLSGVRRQGRAVLVSVVLWGAATAVFALTPVLALAVALLAVAGAADMVSGVFRSTILQVAVPDGLRGRLQSVFFVVVAGGPRLGDLESGGVAALAGPVTSAVSGGIACVVATVLLGVVVPSFRRYDARRAGAAQPVT